MHRVKFGFAFVLAACLSLGIGLAAGDASAEPSDPDELVEKPQDFLEETVEMKGFCLKGGSDGEVLGYECTNKTGVYVHADDIEPEDAKKKLDGECADSKCEMTIVFVPHSYTSSGVIEPDKTVIIYNTRTAKISD